jgi:hypothetical protein
MTMGAYVKAYGWAHNREPGVRCWCHVTHEPAASDRPLFVVWRAAPGVPPGWMPPSLEGRWDYRPKPPDPMMKEPPPDPNVRAVAVRTSRIEHRDSDGASAEVWEVHPAGGNYPGDPADRLPLW